MLSFISSSVLYLIYIGVTVSYIADPKKWRYTGTTCIDGHTHFQVKSRKQNQFVEHKMTEM